MQVSYIIIKNNVILHAALRREYFPIFIATYDEANVVEFFQLEKNRYSLFFNILQGFLYFLAKSFK